MSPSFQGRSLCAVVVVYFGEASWSGLRRTTISITCMTTVRPERGYIIAVFEMMSTVWMKNKIVDIITRWFIISHLLTIRSN